MASLYVLLFILLLYVFFGTIVDVFMTTGDSTKLLRVRTKVFFRTFVAPIIFGLVILFIALTDNKVFNIFFGIVLIIGSLIRIFTGEGKYLTNFHVGNLQLNISYLTPLLKTRNCTLNLTDIAGIEIEKTNWLIDYTEAVNINCKGEWIKFELIDKKLKNIVQDYGDTVKF